MALQAFKNIARSRQTAHAEETNNSFPALLERYKCEIKRALPSHINPDRMVRIALTAFRMNPRLTSCNPRSIFAAVVQASQLGLEVGLMGEAYLVPFKDQCQLIPGYTGLIKLARQSGLVQDVYAHEVRANDEFVLTLGLDRSLEHKPMTGAGGFPATDEERGAVVGFYAVAVLADGSKTFAAMSRNEVERIRNNSSGYQASKRFKKESVWDTDFVAMGLKTAIRRLCKYLPKSSELVTALALDAVANKGKDQKLDLANAVEGSFFTLDEDVEDVAPAAESENEKITAIDKTKSPEGYDPALRTAVTAMGKSSSLKALEEVYEKLKSDFTGEKLEILKREYLRIKENLK